MSAKHQVTLPVEAMRGAGLQIGDRLAARADGPGRIVLERESDPIAENAGALTGVFEQGDLERLRSEWD